MRKKAEEEAKIRAEEEAQRKLAEEAHSKMVEESIRITEENESSTLGALAPWFFICAFFSLVAVFDTGQVEGCAFCCLFLALGCIGMLDNSEGRVGETILKIMVILFIFGIVFMFILDSMMSGGWGGMGMGGLSGWGGP